MSVTLPKELAGPVNLMAPPMAGAVAMTALGFGMASQVFGFWMGAMSGSIAAARRVAEFDLPAGGTVADEASLPAADVPAARRARKAVASMLAEVSVATPAPAAPVADARGSKAPASKASVTKARARKASAAKAALARDDLKAISGIGPKLEKILNDMGLRSYGQIAALSPAEIADLDTRLGFKGRIGRDDWIGQAKALAKGGKA